MPYKSDQSLWRELLKKYTSFRCLWQKHQENSYTAEECETAWEELVEMAQEINQNADKEFVQKRIKDFRAVCLRERKKVETAEGAGKRYQPKIHYYDILNAVLDEEAKEENAKAREANKTNEPSRVVVKEEKDYDRTDTNDIEKELTDEPASKRARNGPAQILARRMAEHLEQMNADQALIAEKIISDICVYGRLKQLNIESSIVLK